MVLNRITWPHEVLYSASGKTAAYDKLTAVPFVSGYLIMVNLDDIQVKAQMTQHLEELMETQIFMAVKGSMPTTAHD